MSNRLIKKILSCLIFVVGLFSLPIYANAATEHEFSLIGVKCPMDDYADLTGDDPYYQCMDDYIAGDLDTYVIGSGDDVDPGTIVMFGLQYVPGDDMSAVAFNTTLTYDTSIWTSIHTSTSDFYDDSVFPKSGRSTKWSVSMNLTEDGVIKILGADTDNFLPLVSETNLYYFFMQLNEDVTPGKSVSINFGQEAGDTDISDESEQSLPYKTTDLTLSVYGNQSKDASLKTLTITNDTVVYPLSPDFAAGDTTNTTYNVVVPNGITSIDIDAVANNEYAKVTSVTYGEETLVAGNTTSSINANSQLAVGNNEFKILITSQLGDVETYTVNVYRLSNDATLSSLTLTNDINIGSLVDGTYTYTANNVPYATHDTEITADPTHDNAFIASGDGTWTFTNAGTTPNVQDVIVKAENCLDEYASVEGNSCTSQTYTITVNRIAASTNNYLSSLTVDGVSVPDFNKETITYNLDPVSNATTTLDIAAVVEDTGKANIVSGTGTVNLEIGDNSFDVVVKAEDGSEKTYTINVRRLSNDTKLMSLNVTSNPVGSLTPAFTSSFEGEYTYTYDPTVTSVTVTATVNDTNNAKVFIADVSDGSTPTGTATLNTATESFNVSTTKVSVVVTAEDGEVQTYPINLNRLKSSNNYLSALSLSEGTLSPEFTSTNRTYTASVDGSVENVEVYAAKAVTYSEITKITGNTDLDFGLNTIEVEVTAEDGTPASYIINLTREKYTIATLDDLTVNGVTVTDFVPADNTKLEYTIANVPYETTSLTINGTKTNSYSTVTGFGNVDLNTGDNEIKVSVTSHDGQTTNEYIINVYREKNPDNTVHGITIAGVVPSIDDDGNYVVTLPNDKETLYSADIVVSVGDGATVNKTTTLPLSTKEVNTYQFTVTSEDGVTETYNILVTREQSNDASISKVTLTIGDDSSRYCLMEGDSCIIGVPVDTTEFSLSADIDSEATIFPKNGTVQTMESTESTKSVILTVKAEDGTSHDYRVVVERQKSSNTNLSDLQVDGVTVPNFKPGDQIYNVSVPGLTDEILVSATVEDTGKATITTDLTNKFILDFGPNQIDVEVKAENGDTKKYTIMVTRENGIDATLKDLQINGVTITGFKPETTDYLLNDVLYSTTSLNVAAVTNDENATASGDGLINLKTGENEIIITVAAHNPNVTKTYTIKVTREENDDTGIKSITLAGNEATYNSTTGNYEVTVPNGVTEANSSNVIVVVNDPIVETDDKATYTVTTTTLVTTGENNVSITVTAEDGTIKVYTLVVIRTKANIATLDTLTVTNGAFNPSFDKDTFEYSVTVPVDTTEFDITAVKTDANSNITSGTNAEGTAHYTMTESTKTIQVVVTSEDLSVTNTYTLNITRTASSVNTLSDITVKNGETTYPLTPEFNADTTEYTVNVEDNIDKVTIDATLTDDRAEILSGEGEHELEVGENTITIRVESESGAANAYTIKVIRAEKSDNNLTSLTVDGVEVPDFDPDTETYTLDDVPYDKTSIEIGATLSDSDANVTGTGKKGLTTGDNSFDVVVTAQNGDTKTYTINIKRAKNNNAKLQLLSLNGSALEPTFESTTYDYSVTVKSTKTTLSPDEITAVPEDTNATVKKQETITLSTTVDNFYTIEVTAEDGVTKETYTIQVIRPKSSDATLASVDLKDTATISPAFDPTTYEYTLTVPYGNTSFSIEGIPNVETTSVFGDGDFTTESDVVKITTQAEDGSSILVYVFNVVEAASNDATLSGLSVTGYPFKDKTFQSTDLNYSIGNIPYSTTQLKIEATKTNANATIQYYVDGSEQLSNIVSIPQVLGTKTITVRVTAADGVTTRDYNISYTVVNSDNAYLSNIASSIGEINFNKTTFNYNDYTVENGVTSVDFTITTEDSNASITVNGESFFTPKKITVSDLPVGTKTLTILVTAQDGSTTQTYNVVIRRQAPALSDDANLSSLSVEGYSFDKTFNMDTLEYSIGSIPFSVTELTINATLNMGTSSISYSVNGVGQSDNVVTIPKVEGTGAITVKVTAEDGKTVKSYKITYSKTASTNAYLSNILVSSGSLDKEFNKNTFDYTVNVDRTVSSIDITAITEDQTAIMKMNGVTYTSPHMLTISPLNAGNTEVLILVTAENGNVVTYKVTITKEADPASTITSVEYGHTITNGYIRTVKLATTGIDMKNQLDNENKYLEIWTADESRQVGDNETLATGMIVKLIIDGEEKDRKYIVIKGDTSGDGEIDLFDAVKILNHYLVRTPLTDAYLEAAYVNDDTDIDLFDSVMILNHYLGRISLH